MRARITLLTWLRSAATSCSIGSSDGALLRRMGTTFVVMTIKHLTRTDGKGKPWACVERVPATKGRERACRIRL